MTNEDLMNKIIDKATEEILKRIAEPVHEEVADLVKSMAKATVDILNTCQEDCEAKCGNKKADKDEPVSLEIHMHGLQLDEDDRLRFSKMVCDFIDSLEEGEGDEGDEGEEEEEEDDGPGEACVETVTIKVDRKGKATMERKIVELDSDGESDE